MNHLSITRLGNKFEMCALKFVFQISTSSLQPQPCKHKELNYNPHPRTPSWLYSLGIPSRRVFAHPGCVCILTLMASIGASAMSAKNSALADAARYSDVLNWYAFSCRESTMSYFTRISKNWTLEYSHQSGQCTLHTCTTPKFGSQALEPLVTYLGY